METPSSSENSLGKHGSIQTTNGDRNNVGHRPIPEHDIQEAHPIPVLGAKSQGQGRFKGVLRRKIKNYFLTAKTKILMKMDCEIISTQMV